MKKQTLHRLMTWAAALLLPVMSLQAMPYDEARDKAWFLTDKMAHELSLTQEQYERAYQINLDYLISIETASDCAGRYWTYRNADFECILLPWQYALYVSLDYFFRPVRWLDAAWYFPVYEHYRRSVFYFSRPAVYVSYVPRGWRSRSRNDPSPYRNFRPGGVKVPVATDKASRNPGDHFVPVRKQQPQTVGRPSTNRPTNQPSTRPAQKNSGQQSTPGRRQGQGNSGRQFGTTQRTGGTQQNAGRKNSNTQQTRPAQKNSGQQSTPGRRQGRGNSGRQFGTTQRTGGTQQSVRKTTNQGSTKTPANRKTTTKTK